MTPSGQSESMAERRAPVAVVSRAVDIGPARSGGRRASSSSWPGASRRASRVRWPAIVVLLAGRRRRLVARAHRSATQRSRRRPRPADRRRCVPDGLNLLVITLDTTRADRIGRYGYRRRRDADARPPGARRRPVRTDDGVGAAHAAGPLPASSRAASRRNTACATTAASSCRRTS